MEECVLSLMNGDLSCDLIMVQQDWTCRLSWSVGGHFSIWWSRGCLILKVCFGFHKAPTDMCVCLPGFRIHSILMILISVQWSKLALCEFKSVHNDKYLCCEKIKGMTPDWSDFLWVGFHKSSWLRAWHTLNTDISHQAIRWEHIHIYSQMTFIIYTM